MCKMADIVLEQVKQLSIVLTCIAWLPIENHGRFCLSKNLQTYAGQTFRFVLGMLHLNFIGICFPNH